MARQHATVVHIHITQNGTVYSQGAAADRRAAAVGIGAAKSERTTGNIQRYLATKDSVLNHTAECAGGAGEVKRGRASIGIGHQIAAVPHRPPTMVVNPSKSNTPVVVPLPKVTTGNRSARYMRPIASVPWVTLIVGLAMLPAMETVPPPLIVVVPV